MRTLLKCRLHCITAVQNGQKTAYKAIHNFNVAKQTWYDQLGGKLPHAKAYEKNQILTNAEEKELVRWICRLTFTNYPPRPATLWEMAEEIKKRRFREIISVKNGRMNWYNSSWWRKVTATLQSKPKLWSGTPFLLIFLHHQVQFYFFAFYTRFQANPSRLCIGSSRYASCATPGKGTCCQSEVIT